MGTRSVRGRAHANPHPHLPRSTDNIQHISRNNMSSTSNHTTSTPSNFGALFEAALANYTKRTGQDLRKHPMATAIERCESPDSILAIFQKQSQAFDKFRNGDPKLIKWLAPVVNGLYTISTIAVASDGASIVGRPNSVFYYQRSLILASRLSPLQMSFFLALASFSLCVSLPLSLASS